MKTNAITPVVVCEKATKRQVLSVLRMSVREDPEAYTQFGGSLPTDDELVAQAEDMFSGKFDHVSIMASEEFPSSMWLMLHPKP